MGAIRLRFGRLSSTSLSLSRLVPTGTAFELWGVSGGVVIGTPVTLPEFAAVSAGTCPEINGGLLITLAGSVATDEVELDRAGEDGLADTNDAGGGDGAVMELFEFRCWW